MRLPRNNALAAESTPARFRTIFVAEAADESEIRTRIVDALASGSSWTLIHITPVPRRSTRSSLSLRARNVSLLSRLANPRGNMKGTPARAPAHTRGS
jgi:hypothetical protein